MTTTLDACPAGQDEVLLVHPLAVLVEQFSTALDGVVGGSPVWSMSPSEQRPAGVTDLVDGRLLCGPHHRRIHDPPYTHTLAPDGKVSFHRRE